MKLLILSTCLLLAVTSIEHKITETKPIKLPQKFELPLESASYQKSIIFVPNITCKLEVIELKDLTFSEIDSCIKKDHSWLKI
jgi:hypothetical protein